jgi:hypothetical protein
MMQKASVSYGKTKDGQDGEGGRVTLCSPFKDVVYRVSHLWSGVNVNGKKKVMKKQRRSSEKN